MQSLLETLGRIDVKMVNKDTLIALLESEEVPEDAETDSTEVEEIESDGDIKSKSVLKSMVKRFSKRLSKFRPGLEITCNYKDQKEYTYKLSRRVGVWNEYSSFKPELTPPEILKLGVAHGKKFNDCFREFPREWFLDALDADKLSVLRPLKKFNYYKVDEDVHVEDWRDEDHDSLVDQNDPRGWLQWYFRFYLGRRDPSVDKKQINRWIAFNKRHTQLIKSSCKEKDDRCKPKVKQAMLSWAIDSRNL